MPAGAARAAASSWPDRSDEAEQLATQILGMTLVTHQTGPEGQKVGRVLIEEGLQIERELYLSIVIDRAQRQPGRHGQRRRRHGHRGGRGDASRARSCARHIDPGVGFVPFQARKLAFGMGLDGAAANKFVKVLTRSTRRSSRPTPR